MGHRTESEDAGLTSLRQDYRTAFHNWAVQTERLHEDGTGPGPRPEETQADADAAEIAYRHARDRLVWEMMHKDAAVLGGSEAAQ